MSSISSSSHSELARPTKRLRRSDSSNSRDTCDSEENLYRFNRAMDAETISALSSEVFGNIDLAQNISRFLDTTSLSTARCVNKALRDNLPDPLLFEAERRGGRWLRVVKAAFAENIDAMFHNMDYLKRRVPWRELCDFVDLMSEKSGMRDMGFAVLAAIAEPSLGQEVDKKGSRIEAVFQAKEQAIHDRPSPEKDPIMNYFNKFNFDTDPLLRILKKRAKKLEKCSRKIQT